MSNSIALIFLVLFVIGTLILLYGPGYVFRKIHPRYDEELKEIQESTERLREKRKEENKNEH